MSDLLSTVDRGVYVTDDDLGLRTQDYRPFDYTTVSLSKDGHRFDRNGRRREVWRDRGLP